MEEGEGAMAAIDSNLDQQGWEESKRTKQNPEGEEKEKWEIDERSSDHTKKEKCISLLYSRTCKYLILL